MRVLLKTLFSVGILDLQRCSDILSECDVDTNTFADFIKSEVENRKIDPFSMDIIGLVYDYILKIAKREIEEHTGTTLANSVCVSTNSLATDFNYSPTDSDTIQIHLEMILEGQRSHLLSYFISQVMWWSPEFSGLFVWKLLALKAFDILHKFSVMELFNFFPNSRLKWKIQEPSNIVFYTLKGIKLA